MKPKRALRASVVLVVLAGVAAPAAARAQSYLLAGVTSSIWGAPAYSCGTNSGNVLAPTATIAQSCSHTYTNVHGSSSTIQLDGAAQTGFGHITMEATGSWSNLSPPDFSPSWGVTASVTETAGGQNLLYFSVINDGNVDHTYALGATVSVSGNVYFTGNVPLDPILFPFIGEAHASLSLSLAGLGAACNPGVNSGQANAANRIAPNGYHLSATCTTVTPTITIPAHSYTPFVMFLEGIASSGTDPFRVTALAASGNYGMDADFSHTIGLTEFRAFVDGVAVDPATLDIASQLPVRITSAGLVSTIPSAVPEPGALVLVATGLLSLAARARLTPSSRG